MAAGLVENLQREDLNPVEEAEGYQRLLTEFQLSQEALGEAVGKSRAHIGNVMRLLKLPQAVLDMVRAGTLSSGHARALVMHPNPVSGAKAVIAKNLTVRQAEEMVNGLGRTFTDKALSKPPPARLVDSDIAALAEALGEKLGLRVKVTFNGKSGMLQMSYKDLDQLDEILRLLHA
jgi:ParB family chromosome partitioning protein